MRQITAKQFSLLAGTVITTIGLAAAPAAAIATRPGVTAAPRTTSSSTANNGADQAKLKLIISRGDNEINRRLKTLNTLSTKINSAAKLSSSDKSLLAGEVNDEISALTSLKTKLDADTDLATAKTDAQSIIEGYRVYALIVPKVQLVKTADDQQVAEGKLTDLAAKLQTRITTAQGAGKNVADLQAKLSDLNSKVSAAQAISSGVESGVINLQPTDYNGNHSVLSGDRDKLKTAQSDIQAAIADAKSIISGLKSS
jgi:hypothetical protein